MKKFKNNNKLKIIMTIVEMMTTLLMLTLKM